MNANQDVPLPRIRQTLFMVDKNRNYKFDVNQNITIRGLKKMIINAANLGKSGLRVFHKGIEYTEYDDSSLDELFPEMQLVEFSVSIVYVEEHEKEANIKVKLGKYCPRHDFKYPYFYCYTCKMSMCSICLAEHRHHNFIEKYDYLQSSRNLVESIFQDLLKDFQGEKSRRLDEKSLEEMKTKIKANYSSNLMEMIAKIERRQIELLDFFFDIETQSVNNMQNNVSLLKSHCSEGLDRLKNEIAIEDMMLDEDIFLTFDRKFKEITVEKTRIINDAKKFDQFKLGLEQVMTLVETTHNDIYLFLERYVNSNVYNEMKTKINESHIHLVSKDEIIGKMLSDVKKRPGHSSSERAQKSRVESQIGTPHPERNLTPLLAQCVPGSKDVILYDNSNHSILRRTVDFPQLIGVDSFPINCAYLNVNGKMYVSGGLNRDKGGSGNNPSDAFFYYDCATNSLTKLPEMPIARHSHSMFYHADTGMIFVVGGVAETYKFDTKSLKWHKLSSLNVEDRMHPILFMTPNNYLYAFFGTAKGGANIDTVERLNTKNMKSKWEVVAYTKKSKDLDLKVIGSGIIQAGEKEIYLFGGKGKDGSLLSSAIKFDFSSNSFDKVDLQLDEGICFHESLLVDLGDHTFGQFNAEKLENFFKIQLG